ncbi:threonine dehydratase [Clostridium pascui]|uniref:threonine ammonia-lyase n=1 Tax=Clostridium pascui TaxID=46609 RepID=UPI00195E0EB3|nr:threonine ammonia-lyase [Clostridium pascui]MBM7871229.1 threonine dehydratase [Clostridium pascui]
MQLRLNFDMIKKAQENIKGVARKTPLFYSSTFSNITGYNIYLKCEDKQKTGSFKLRGAYNKVCCLTEEEKKCGVIASSAGNHAQGVAYAATAFGVKSTIFMPITAPMAKVNATRGYGAEVVQFGEVYDDCYNKAIEMQKTTGATFLHPFNDDEVMAGQGTIALEVFEELPEVDTIIAPIGGGGLISGIAVAAKALKPSIKIIGVQAEIIASTKASLEAGKVTTVPGAKSLADGISVMTPGDKTFEYMKRYVDEVITVTEDEIAFAMFSLMDRSKLIAEGAGATSLAALLAGKIKNAGKNVVSIISGGNIDIAMASKIIERELTRLNRRISFDVQLIDRVGQLGSLITLIGKLGGNIIKVRQEENWDEAGLDYANVKLVIATESKDHSDNILEGIKKNGYKLI